MSSFRKALLLTAIPLVALGIALGLFSFSAAPFPLVWLAGLVPLASVVAAISFYIAGKKSVASGILAGIAAGVILGFTAFIVAAWVSCFTYL